MTKSESIRCMRGERPIDIFLTKCSDHVRLNVGEPSITLTPKEAWALGGKLRRMASGLIGNERQER
jgi:hypothetical protein